MVVSYADANVGQVGLDVPVKFSDSISNGSRDIQQRSRRMRHSRPFLNFNNCQPEVVSDVISGVVADPMGVKVGVKCGNSRSNSSRDIRLPQFVTNDDANDASHHIKAKRVLPKNRIFLI